MLGWLPESIKRLLPGRAKAILQKQDSIPRVLAAQEEKIQQTAAENRATAQTILDTDKTRLDSANVLRKDLKRLLNKLNPRRDL